MTKPLNLTQFDGHTPGPWALFEGDPHSRTLEIGLPGKLGQRPCVVGWPGFDSNDLPLALNRKNARLIAAAPALLAECKRLAEQNAELVAALQALLDADITTESGIEATKLARAALAKAQP